MAISKKDDGQKHKTWRGVLWVAAGLLLLGWLLNTPAGLLGKADAVGYAVCHRIDLHSFHPGDRQLPLCARCSGMYLGVVAGLTFQIITARRKSGIPPLPILIVLGGMAAAFVVDGVNSLIYSFPGLPILYKPDNTVRLFTGGGMGLVLSIVIYYAFNQTAWRDVDLRTTVPGFRSLGTMVLLVTFVNLLVMSENPLLLYPLAVISAAGVIVILTMVYTLLGLMILRLENRFMKIQELALPLLGGFAVALLQIGLLDLGRYLLTGTWDGFQLG